MNGLFCRMLVYTKYPPSKNAVPSLEQTLPLRMLCALFGWNLPGSFKVRKLFSISCNILPMEKGKLEFPSSIGVLCRGYLSFTQWFWRRRCLKVGSLFPLFLQKKISAISFLTYWQRAWSLFQTNLNPLHTTQKVLPLRSLYIQF